METLSPHKLRMDRGSSSVGILQRIAKHWAAFLVLFCLSVLTWRVLHEEGQASSGGAESLASSMMCNHLLHDVLSGTAPVPVARMQLQQELQTRLNAYHDVFGYPIIEGNTGTITAQQTLYMQLASIPCVKTVCEIGFNAGHSATVWLTAKDDLTLISFDIGNHPYTYSALRFMKLNFPGRVISVLGDSLLTVPNITYILQHKCDILVVDGGHDYRTALGDIQNMRALATHPFNVFVIDDVNCVAQYCLGPERALADAERHKWVNTLHRVAMLNDGQVVPVNHTQRARGFSVGTYLP